MFNDYVSEGCHIARHTGAMKCTYDLLPIINYTQNRLQGKNCTNKMETFKKNCVLLQNDRLP